MNSLGITKQAEMAEIVFKFPDRIYGNDYAIGKSRLLLYEHIFWGQGRGNFQISGQPNAISPGLSFKKNATYLVVVNPSD